MRQTGDRLRTHSSQQPTSKPVFSFSSPARIWRLVFATLSLLLQFNYTTTKADRGGGCKINAIVASRTIAKAFTGGAMCKSRVAKQPGHCLHFFGSCFSSTTNLASWQQCSENDSTIPSSWKVFTLHFIFLPSPCIWTDRRVCQTRVCQPSSRFCAASRKGLICEEKTFSNGIIADQWY